MAPSRPSQKPKPPRAPSFLDLPPERRDPERSRVWLLPLPYERTSSYRSGSARLPDALLRASAQVEFYDDELACEPCRHGIATLDPLRPRAKEPDAAVAEMGAALLDLTLRAPFLAIVGGEHTVTVPAVEAAHSRYGELTVLQLDAHADLRESYDGTRWSHASAMRRLAEGGTPVVGAGIRAVSKEETEALPGLPVRHFPAREIAGSDGWQREVVEALGERVYVTVDLDAFDPSQAPSVGTPVPGGLSWYPVLRLLRLVAEERHVVGCDVVEGCPAGGGDPTAFLAAQLLYKLLGYVLESRSAHRAP